MKDDRLIRLPEVLARVGLRKTKVYALIAAGEFPKPVKLGRDSLWVESEVSAWIQAQAASRQAA
ncbi:MAG: helix-turn-helix transcriptional regulator [Sinimarinibacterium flocculans]|uniref:helix-turn-helix transcriptional regulator n=1 Tax=Sinimarinibacterium flocculans TaxID=985250 RepID=UPI003C3CA6CB